MTHFYSYRVSMCKKKLGRFVRSAKMEWQNIFWYHFYCSNWLKRSISILILLTMCFEYLNVTPIVLII